MSRIVFFGTPEFVLPVLEALKNSGHEILAVITQPSKPIGRRQILTPSPVAIWAEKHQISVVTDVKEAANLNADLGIVAAYGKIIPSQVIESFPHGLINIHPSLLPKYRGASPIQAVIAAGEKETGVTIMKIDEEMDHGPLLYQFTSPIKKTDTTGSLRERVFEKSAKKLVEILPSYLEGKIKPQEQEHEKATYTKLVRKEHGFIPPGYVKAVVQDVPLNNEEWQIPFIKNYSLLPSAQSLEQFIRALDPWPGSWTYVHLNKVPQRLKILKAHVEKNKLVLDQVQLEGKNPVSWEQFNKGYPEANF